MAITRTAFIDDDGSGTTGTVINNAVKQELYDQIDAAIGAVGTPNNLGYDLLPDVDTTRKLGSAAKSWDGSEIIALNASALATGTVAAARLPVAVTGGVVALTDGATPALDASLGSVFTLAAAGDRTIGIPSNPTAGQKIIIRHLASGGARTLALNSGAGGFRFGSDITALTATASGKTDYIGAIYNATDSKWDVVAVAKGF